ncbi:plant virulence effector HPE1-like domain-containing protein [Rhizobium rhizoryzae]|jgi:hypothetical protein|uniref:Uncharacterized protein n=1 Tax=Rhizobium rhizoryzae TaxID=451876 RepID=A0A7W6LEZ9_9HYPH|nr:plant virulence effector HPE1-like domain-containing protein [Rhizobium rhizoryzae]MBB4143016.1 hypothetical protein [Rhizobium rhizoryzae]
MISSVLALVASVAAVSADMTSISVLSGQPLAATPSVVRIACTHCDGKAPRRSKSEYVVPSLDAGHERVTISQIGGKPAVTRTENFMGGSPVRFVSVNPMWVEREQQLMLSRTVSPTKSDGVDQRATTSAVSADAAPKPVAATPVEQPAAPDFSKFELRPSL